MRSVLEDQTTQTSTRPGDVFSCQILSGEMKTNNVSENICRQTHNIDIDLRCELWSIVVMNSLTQCRVMKHAEL